MTMHFADLARQAAAGGAISSEEILALRRAGWGDGAMTAEEVEATFVLNDALAAPSAEWSDFFVEAIGEFVINGTEPRGYVSEDNAHWLIARIGRDGVLQGMTELELLVRVLERGVNVPDALKAFVLEQVEQAVLTGSGPTRRGGELSPGHVNAAEASILRRVLFAPAGDGPAVVSCAEAELLFRLKDATLGAANTLEWKQLFVQGVASYLQGVASRTAQLSRERAAELEAFVADDSTHVAGFIGRMAKAAPNAFGIVFGKKQPGRDRLADLHAAEQVTGGEQKWLDAHVNADGAVDAYEQALIAFLAGGSV
ncbi:MAG TPA: hypothetical protein VFS49_12345 [Croceibacterium sp.]|nr:hypothetical protein [Croceibacterium sp.]